MARCRPVLNLLTLAATSAGLLAFTAGSFAQNPSKAPAEIKADEPKPCPQTPPPATDAPKPDGEKKADRGPGPHGDGKDGKGKREWRGRKWENLTPEQMQERALRDLEKLTPEQRHEVWRAVWAVLNLPQEKKQEIIGMD